MTREALCAQVLARGFLNKAEARCRFGAREVAPHPPPSPY